MSILIIIGLVVLAYFLIKASQEKKEQKKRREKFYNTPFGADFKKFDEDEEGYLADLAESFNDYLGEAAELKHKGLLAIKNKEFNTAWKSFNEQNLLLLKHANECNFSQRQTLNLTSNISENHANICRLENKHLDALIHILYWISTSLPYTTKSQEKKLVSYFNRTKIKNVQINEVREFVNTMPGNKEIKNQLRQWIDKEKKVEE